MYSWKFKFCLVDSWIRKVCFTKCAELSFWKPYFHSYFIRKRSGKCFQGSCEQAQCCCWFSDRVHSFHVIFWSAGVAVAFSGWQRLSLASVSCRVPDYTKLISVPRPETLTWADRDEKCGVGRHKKRTLTEASCSHYRTQPPPTSADVFWWEKLNVSWHPASI